MTEKYLLYNANIYCGIPFAQAYTALLVEGDTIRAVGEQALRHPKDMSTHVLDLQGATVWPGLVDSHLHLAQLAEQLNAVDCETKSLNECLERIQKKTAALPKDGSWIRGFGFNQNAWDPPQYPNRADLDRVSNGHPIVIYAKSLHASWANSSAFQLAGIDESTPDPKGGRILRDSFGSPTGVLIENASLLVDQVIPPLDAQETHTSLRNAQNFLFSLGITTVHDFDRWNSLESLFSLQESGELFLNVIKQMPCDSLSRLLSENLRSKLTAYQITPGWIKCFADGALGPQSAAMLQPYENSTECGLLLLTEDELLETGKQAAAGAWPLSVHAIGDAANQLVLRAFARLREYEAQNKLPHLLHRVEHAQMLAPQDIAAFKELNVIASMQPIHASSDMHTAQRHWGDRNATSYAWHALEQAGARLIFGSDAPVESPNPFLGLYAAVTRRNLSGEPGPQGWHPENRVSLRTALDAYTVNPGLYCSTALRGRLAPGWKADLIILDEDPFTLSTQDLAACKVRSTMVNGKFVYERNEP